MLVFVGSFENAEKVAGIPMLGNMGPAQDEEKSGRRNKSVMADAHVKLWSKGEEGSDWVLV